MSDSELVRLPVALRAYAQTGNIPYPPPRSVQGLPEPSEWVLVFDTETTVDPAQRLRFGTYQVRRKGVLRDAGIFYDAEALTDADIEILQAYSSEQRVSCMPVAVFIEDIFFGVGYELNAAIVGFNLPFDISRIAIAHSSARGDSMRGGFSFALSPDRYRPRVQVKHLSSRDALIRFTTPEQQVTPRGMRKRGDRVPIRRGFFIDVRTVAAALTSRSFNLAGLAEFLKVPSRKLATEAHGAALTPEYIGYAVRDTQTTWECFDTLRDRYGRLGLSSTPLHRIHSEASLGKAYLKEMGIKPWRQNQPDFPPELLGHIMSTYYGGRAEVHIRREAVPVAYCDFLSMYPTVCTLMGLWQFVIAEGVEWRDATEEVQHFLDRLELTDLHEPSFWRQLSVIVQVKPDADIFPVRAIYDERRQYNIGLNYLSSEEPFWYTLADCIASKLLTGKAPKILQAVSFAPLAPQDDLAAVDIAGNPDYRVDPATGDFYKRVIDLRSSVKNRLKQSKDQDERVRLDTEQAALKILANATSYGIFVELNVKPLVEKVPVICHGAGPKSFRVDQKKIEEPGRYFHPLLATLITGAARLMLAITERLVVDAGLDWAFCDTDSMAITRPDDMPEIEFRQKVEAVREWFTPLNPYEQPGALLKLEDANFAVADGTTNGDLAPLYCFAVSAKRYALFNIDAAGNPVIRKASGHGLGHLLPPYTEPTGCKGMSAPRVSLKEIGVAQWQHDFWYCIIIAALEGHPDQLDLSMLPNLDEPALSRYAATTPALLRWFRHYNEGRPYSDHVRPFNFLTAMQAHRIRAGMDKMPKPTAPYRTDPAQAVTQCFDRETGKLIDASILKTYRETLAQYHLSPEPKFANGDFRDRGKMLRRHVEPSVIRHIGKEANRWEEQMILGHDPSEQIEYGIAPNDEEEFIRQLRSAKDEHGATRIARAAGVTPRYIYKLINGESRPSKETMNRLARLVAKLLIG